MQIVIDAKVLVSGKMVGDGEMVVWGFKRRDIGKWNSSGCNCVAEIYTQTHVHTNTHIYAHKHTHTYIHTNTHTYIHTQTHTHIYTQKYKHKHKHTHKHKSINTNTHRNTKV